jgi:hypothetical protein
LKTIEIVVSPKGESHIETKGFTGTSCQEASRFIESALGKRAGGTLKPEFHIQTPSENSVENSN